MSKYDSFSCLKRNICEAVAYYRSFKLVQERTNIYLNMWLQNIRKGEKKVSQNEHSFILRPLDDMMRSLDLWKRASDLNPSRFPPGCFTTLTADELRTFWENRKC